MAPQTIRCHPPVVVGIAVDPKIERGRDDKHAAGLEQAIDFVERLADGEDMFKRFDAEDGAGRFVGQANGRDVLDAIDARTGAHVAADIAF